MRGVIALIHPDGRVQVFEEEIDVRHTDHYLDGFAETVKLPTIDLLVDEDGGAKGLKINPIATSLLASLGGPVRQPLVGRVIVTGPEFTPLPWHWIPLMDRLAAYLPPQPGDYVLSEELMLWRISRVDGHSSGNVLQLNAISSARTRDLAVAEMQRISHGRSRVRLWEQREDGGVSPIPSEGVVEDQTD